MPPAPPTSLDHPTGEQPAASAARGRAAFAVLRLRNYRLFIASQVVANTGVWMQRIAQDWLVLTMTGSVTAVGITAALQFTPVVLFGLFGGVLADRHSKRLLLIITQSIAAALAAILALLTFSGTLQVEHVYAVALALGLVTAVDNPARQVFVPELVGREHLRTAVSLNSSVFQLGGLVGPAIGGALIAGFGEGWAFAANAVGCAVVVLMLCLVRSDLLHRVPTVARAPGQLRAGLRYVRDTPHIFWTVVLVGSVGAVALNMPVVLTGFSDRVFGNGAAGFGMFNAMLAVGGVLGALAATQRRAVRLRSLVALAVLLGVALATASIAPTSLTFAIGLVTVGTTTLVLLIGANLLVQVGVDVAMRGRVMALFVMVQLGGRAVGAPAIGWVSEELGPRPALLAAGSVMVLAAVAVGLVLARSGSLRLSLQLPSRRHRTGLAITPRAVRVQPSPDLPHRPARTRSTRVLVGRPPRRRSITALARPDTRRAVSTSPSRRRR